MKSVIRLILLKEKQTFDSLH